MERGEWSKAASLLSKAMDSCPIDPDARQYYAEALWRRGAKTEALREMLSAVNNSPDNPLLILRYGQMQLDAANADGAWRCAHRALQIDGRLAEAWRLRARVYCMLRQPEPALANYQRALSLAPSDTETLKELAEVYQQLGQPERALVTVQSLLDQYSPGEEPQQAIELQGNCLAALQRHSEAADALSLACDRGIPSAELLGKLGHAQLASAQLEAAQSTAVLAERLHPNHPTIRQFEQSLQVALERGDGQFLR